MTAKPRKPGHVLLVTLCAAAGLTGSGCSFIFVDGPPTQHRKMPYFDCTSSNALPVVDVVVAVAEGASGIAELANHDQYTTSSSQTAAVTAIGVAALFAASGIHGFGKTSDCREAKAELFQRTAQQPGSFGAPGFAPASPPPGYGAPAPYDPWAVPPAAGTPPDAPPPGASAAPAPAAPAKPAQAADPDAPANP